MLFSPKISNLRHFLWKYGTFTYQHNMLFYDTRVCYNSFWIWSHEKLFHSLRWWPWKFLTFYVIKDQYLQILIRNMKFVGIYPSQIFYFVHYSIFSWIGHVMILWPAVLNCAELAQRDKSGMLEFMKVRGVFQTFPKLLCHSVSITSRYLKRTQFVSTSLVHLCVKLLSSSSNKYTIILIQVVRGWGRRNTCERWLW